MQHKARKRFGQNFLIDSQIIERIVATIAPRAKDNLIEIGPGKGALTLPLLENLNAMKVIEIDRDLIALLESQNHKKLTVIEADALIFDFGQLEEKARIVGNLPYNISSPLLFHLLEHRSNVIDMTFMLQKEVVDRIVAPHGSKTYGRLSVMLQAFFDVELMFSVPKESFDPQPKIESAIIYFKPRTDAALSESTLLQKVVKAAFSQRRKTLRNCLKSILTQEQTDIDLSQRAEMLSVDEFINLTKDYAKQN
ncbi:MAG TPA: 16S rRNA (adenine(1518)-N(6)/adenine(1519)-N(6))-dimethyltransferase RsmA [Candidatus Thioglobus sp.]|jgi:16S rRNA (adenine1518-N6/adenine1519-N6)-dimethyltransferase|nr:16S rRNA (adenine(1518)-N(6)/adenine(1519)-N(6))-dimethyltransferase RsmA [Candidatus Thioglobus sp.]HIL21389.1 16S rRNA (adenine(1518)-N(6)/adenine(1519)-N(6))-dimethyltransferase RsmA [Candidatus Thioglobus sp.]